MKELVNYLRRDLGNPDLPVVVAQIAGVYQATTVTSQRDADLWSGIREQQRLLAETIPGLAVVPTIDLSCDDFIHLGGRDQHRLGVRFAQAMSALMGKNDEALPLELESVELTTNKWTGNLEINALFNNVVGQLEAAGKPTGFALLQGREEISNTIYRIDLKGNCAIVKTSICPPVPRELQLYYGYGLSPYVNITDSMDRSLPAFGPYHLASS